MKNFLLTIFLAGTGLLMICLISCATLPPAPPEPGYSKPVEKEYPVNGWGTGRDKMAYDALVQYGRDLIAAKPKDIYEWCPNYTPAKTIRFYISLASALTKYESNWRSSVTYQEAFSDVKGKPVISRGLAQISIESANSYGCGIKDAKELHDDQTNINCLIKIWNRWIVRDNQIGDGIKGDGWRGAERYHSPFRKPDHIAVMRKAVEGVCRGN